MKRKKLLSLIALFCLFKMTISGYSQTYSQGDSLVVFYPNTFDSSKTLPSLAVINEPLVEPGVPGNWSLIPEFYTDPASNASCAKINIHKGIDLYGTGEVTGLLRRNNTEINLWNTDNYGYHLDNGKELYQSHPWVLGMRDDGSSFGIIADNTWPMTINLTDSTINFYSDGPPFRIIIFEAENPQNILEELAALTGKMELPPIWALGYHQSRCSYTPDYLVKGVADAFRSRKLPCDVIWLDYLYQNQYKSFTFSPSTFSNPSGLNDYLHDLNFKSVWIVDPAIKVQTGYGPYDQGTLNNCWVMNQNRNPFTGTVWPGTSVFPDFTIPSVQSWWANLYPAFMSNGIDGIWNDMNEPSVFDGPLGTMPATNIHRGGGGLPEDTHQRYHNVYGMLMIKSTHDGVLLSNPEKRPFILSRSNFLGGQRYAATWTGDNESSWKYLKMSIPMSLNLSLSGQPFNGPDVGGYGLTSDANLLGHWMAVGAFYPFYRNHHAGNSQEPWAFGPATQNVCLVALSRRYKLLPYLYTLFHDASKNGLPIMRPVFFADPADKDLRNEQEAFLLGDKLLIVPKWAINPALPKDLWQSISILGENSKLDPYQPDVRLRNGSILPVGQLIQSTADYSTDSLTLLVSVNENHTAKGTLYDDAGEGFDYKTGAYMMRDFIAEPLGDDSLQITCTKREGNLSVLGKKYRVGVVTNYDIFYTGWTNDTIIKVALPMEINASITLPLTNSIYSTDDSIHIIAEASSAIGIEKVVFYYNDSIQIGEILNPPYDLKTKLPAGVHTIFAIAWASSELKMETYPVRVTVNAPTNIYHVNEYEDFSIYPNPADDIVKISFKGISIEKNIALYDLLGRKQLQKKLDAVTDETELETKNLKNGIYFIEIGMQNSISVQKLIIQR